MNVVRQPASDRYFGDFPAPLQTSRVAYVERCGQRPVSAGWFFGSSDLPDIPAHNRFTRSRLWHFTPIPKNFASRHRLAQDWAIRFDPDISWIELNGADTMHRRY
jgi:hypothetical protein